MAAILVNSVLAEKYRSIIFSNSSFNLVPVFFAITRPSEFIRHSPIAIN